MGRHVEITMAEERILEKLAEIMREAGVDNPYIVRMAARELRISPRTIYTTLWRLRKRYNMALKFGEDYRRWRKRLGGRFL